jgi:hypothetical protein
VRFGTRCRLSPTVGNILLGPSVFGRLLRPTTVVADAYAEAHQPDGKVVCFALELRRSRQASSR